MADDRKTNESGCFSSPQDARLTIGYLTCAVSYSVEQELWFGCIDAAQKYGANLICFVGDALRSPRNFNEQANVIYELVNREKLDGLVIFSNGLVHYITHEEFQNFCQRYRPLPMISIAVPIEGSVKVTWDDYMGMYEAVTHLITVHGYRRIAFIRGPEYAPDAEARYRAYTEALANHGIPLNAALIAPGNFLTSAGITAVHLLLDERKLRPGVDIEAIVVANDAMAISALQALQKRGIYVPDDIALLGFDDTVEAKSITPSLTTVRLPCYKVGFRAITLLLKWLQDDEVPEQVNIPTKLVVRQTCGCLSSEIPQTTMRQAAGVRAEGPFETLLVTRREELLTEMIQALGARPGDYREAKWMEELLDEFSAEMGCEPTDTFLPKFNKVLCRVIAKGGDVSAWQNVLSALHAHMLPYLVDDKVSRAHELMLQAQLITGETIWREQTYQIIQVWQRNQALREIGTALLSTFDIKELMNILADRLPPLGISSFYLSLYENPQPYEYLQPVPEWSRLILAYNEQGCVELEPDGLYFPSNHLVPEHLLSPDKPYNVVVEPLYFQEGQIGFVVFEASLRDGGVYDTLRVQISSALKGDLLLAALRDAQQEIVTLEKEALEIQMAGGFAHEMRNALAGAALALNTANVNDETLCQKASDILEEAFHTIEQNIPDNKWDEVITAFQTIDHDQETLDNAIKMANRCIQGALDVTTLILEYARLGKTEPGHEMVNLKQLIEKLIQEQHQRLIEQQITVRLQLAETRPLIGHPSHFHSIINNIVLNACDALLEVKDKRERIIDIILTEEDQMQWLTITDNGNGIPEEDLSKIFEPFFSTKPTVGTGLGLSFVSKLVPMYHGTIDVQIIPGEGTTFTLAFPVPS